jgi:hypothetical protein
MYRAYEHYSPGRWDASPRDPTRVTRCRRPPRRQGRVLAHYWTIAGHFTHSCSARQLQKARVIYSSSANGGGSAMC